VPFFEQVPKQLFPENIIIENSEQMWNVTLFEMLIQYGYNVVIKTKMNTILCLV